METERKLDTFIQIRILKSQKEEWVKLANDKGITITNLVISSVENKLLNSDRKEILNFIYKQGNIFAKIENNINQIAKVVNTEKSISNDLFAHYLQRVSELNKMKLEQNDLLRKIFNLLAK